MKVDPTIGPDGYTIEMTIRTPSQDQNPASGISTAITIFATTVVLGSQPSEGVFEVPLYHGFPDRSARAKSKMRFCR